MSKQTAVEWFWEQLPEILPYSLDTETAVKLQEAKEQALQMAREQMCSLCYVFASSLVVIDNQQVYTKLPEEIYKETYGKEASNEG